MGDKPATKPVIALPTMNQEILRVVREEIQKMSAEELFILAFLPGALDHLKEEIDNCIKQHQIRKSN